VPAPGVYPRELPASTDSHAERAFHRALVASLPTGWFAWHSVRIRTRDNVEGEGDFVIAIPGRGVLVVEVKGGQIEKQGGTWLQSGRVMDRAPREQAHDYKNKLRRKLEERSAPGSDQPWITIATAFPDTAFSTPPTQGDLDGAVLGQQDLAYLGDALRAIDERLFAQARVPRSSAWIDALHALWCETWTPRLTLGARVRQREDELVPLDRDQVGLLDLIDGNARFFVAGGPGTGKTLLAREMYRRLEARGKNVVLVCSTQALAAGLRAEGVTHARTSGELAAELLAKAGVEMQGGAASAAWSSDTWLMAPLHAALDAVPAEGGAGFDAVVVDEAQDFTANDWELVKAVAGGGPLWGFGDEAQGFWEDRVIPMELFPAVFTLKRRYRCPERLALFADQYRPRGAGADGPPVGAFEELRVVRALSAAMVEEKVAGEIQKILGGGARRSDMAVVSLAGQTRTRFGVAKKIGAHAVVRADDPRAGEEIVADTFLRFKGLERAWVIVVEIGAGVRKYETRMHVALTRATVGCVVVGVREEIEGDGRLSV
jgi:hypothetical protein